MLICGKIMNNIPLPLFSFHDQRRLKSVSSGDPDDHADNLDPGATTLTHDEFLPQTLINVPADPKYRLHITI
jgi:hypothetical protein